MSNSIVPLVLQNGRKILVEAVVRGPQLASDQALQADELQASLVDVANMVVNVLRKVKPSKASVEFGVSVGLEAGKVTALLLQGTAAANLKVTLIWEKDGDDRDADPS